MNYSKILKGIQTANRSSKFIWIWFTINNFKTYFKISYFVYTVREEISNFSIYIKTIDIWENIFYLCLYIGWWVRVALRRITSLFLSSIRVLSFLLFMHIITLDIFVTLFSGVTRKSKTKCQMYLCSFYDLVLS